MKLALMKPKLLKLSLKKPRLLAVVVALRKELEGLAARLALLNTLK